MVNYDNYPEELDKLFGTGSSVSEDGGGDGGSLWKAYVAGWKADVKQLNDMGGMWGPKLAEVFMPQLDKYHKTATSGYSSFLKVWQKSFRPDAVNMYYMKNVCNTWIDDIMRSLKDTPGDVRDSKLLESWYGESATKYVDVVRDQSGAMEEYNQLAGQMATLVDQANKTLKCVFRSVKSYGESIESGLHGLQVDDDHWGVHVAYGADVFPQLHTWLSDLYSSGDWIQSYRNLGYKFEDMEGKTTHFKDGHWPKSVVKDLGKLKRGDAGLSEKTGQDKTKVPEPPKVGQDPGQTIAPEHDPSQGTKEGLELDSAS